MWHISPWNTLYLCACAFILLNSRDWKCRLINVGNKILAVANSGGCSDKPLLIAVTSLVFNYPKTLQIYGGNVCRTWQAVALFIQRINVERYSVRNKRKNMFRASFKVRVTSAQFGPKMLKDSTVMPPNIISYLKYIGFFLCVFYRTGRHIWPQQ